MKYLIFQVDHDHGIIREYPMVFPNSLAHSDVALSMRRLLVRQFSVSPRKTKPVAAGSISSLDVAGRLGSCQGDAESLGLKSRGEKDRLLICGFDYNHGST